MVTTLRVCGASFQGGGPVGFLHGSPLRPPLPRPWGAAGTVPRPAVRLPSSVTKSRGRRPAPSSVLSFLLFIIFHLQEKMWAMSQVR